jgi:hypothetical protein
MGKPLGPPECQGLPGAADRKSWSHLKGGDRYDHETRGSRAGLRGEEWVGGRELRKQGRPPRPPRGSPADMPSVGKWRRLAMFPGGFARAGVGGGPTATAIATSGYLSGTGTGTARRVCQVGPRREANGSRLARWSLRQSGAVRGIGCRGQSSGELAVPIVRCAAPATAPPRGGDVTLPGRRSG